MAQSGVLTSFLASIGFKADEKSLKSALGRVAAFGLSVKMVTAGIYAGAIRAAQAEAELARQAELLGTTTTKLRELEYAAAESGASMQSLQGALQALVNKNPRIKDSAAALEQVAARMKGLGVAQRRVYAQKLGIDDSLIPMLTSDISGLRREFQTMHAAFGVDAKQSAAASKGLAGEFGKLIVVGKMLAQSVALPFIVKFKTSLAELRENIIKNSGRIRRILEGIISIVLRVSAVVSAAISRVISVISALVDWFDSLDAGQRKVIVGVAAFLAAWKLLNLGFLLSPLGLLITGFAALLLLIEDYYVWTKGGKSRIDWGPWAKTIEQVTGALKALAPYLKWIGAAFLGNAAGGKILKLVGIIKTLPKALALVTTGIKLLGVAVRANPIGLLLSALALGAGLIIENWQRVKDFFSDLWDDIEASLPQWLKELLGLSPSPLEEYTKGQPKSGPVSVYLQNAEEYSRQLTGPALTPGPAQAASISNSVNNRETNITAKTDIHVQSTDPQAAGREAARENVRAFNEVSRNMRPVVR